MAVMMRGERTPAARTLVDVVFETAMRWPERAALDDGAVVLSYADLLAAAYRVAGHLHATGVGRGDRVGVRVASGTAGLYVAILGVLASGAACIAVDADEAEERVERMFGQAGVRVALDGDPLGLSGGGMPPRPAPEDDAWLCFTSGSTGMPKGVVVGHRAAAAFVDAEARLFLQDQPIGPGDRVLAHLSVGFDASWEEIWLAWRHGACLVPVPRALVRGGFDLGPWIERREITVVSTVPTLAALLAPRHLDGVRLIVLGGETCPPQLANRLLGSGAEVWNTYGPTEATVVTCAARLRPDRPVRIGLPLDGWDVAVVNAAGNPVAAGEIGELIIGGVGLARYLDPDLDARRFAPLRTVGWGRAYRTGDLVRYEPEGLLFAGRKDDQVKIGGRRIELGEVDAALLRLPDVRAAAAALRPAPSGEPLLVGYLVLAEGSTVDQAASRELLRTMLPPGIMPTLVPIGSLPTLPSGKVDRAALPELPAAA